MQAKFGELYKDIVKARVAQAIPALNTAVSDRMKVNNKNILHSLSFQVYSRPCSVLKTHTTPSKETRLQPISIMPMTSNALSEKAKKKAEKSGYKGVAKGTDPEDTPLISMKPGRFRFIMTRRYFEYLN